ncbi:hypothetical protein [Marinimicrobium sp. LS-A18]|uniref:hypothetical protein n=1 Tax=Marinimicrobium sp. LS-A18 TaxID=1381596 RepID=UPI0004668523|nr:hypothetical protein [Marinimicrobium sp. LS-A18]
MNEENLLTKRVRSLALAMFLVLSGGAFLTGCDQGPAEEAGEKIDDAVDDAGDAMDDAADEAEDAVE